MTTTAFKEALFWCGLSATLIGLLSPGLFDSQIPAFRDTFHFYYPLISWLEDERVAGNWFPMWNSFDGLGNGTASESTTALFYPLRSIFLISFLPIEQRLSLYILVHLLIGALGLRVACRQLSLSRTSGSLASVAYVLSGPVFFQHSNLVYLCGAAWVPWVLADLAMVVAWIVKATDPKNVSHFDRASGTQFELPIGIRSGLAVAMMVFCGDIQSAVHANLLIWISVILCALLLRRWSKLGKSIAWCARASFLAIVLSAAQWVPTLHAVLNSDRLSSHPSVDTRTLVEAGLSEPIADDWNRLADEFVGGAGRFDSSIPPWHLLTVIWPTLGGHFLPEHSRWFQAVPGEGRMWTPSLYFGLVPCIFATLGIWRRKSPWERWLVCVVVATGLAAMGNYGPVWLVRQFFSAIGWRAWVDAFPSDRTASLYDLLCQIVPGYSAFRFPAKWTTWFVCAACLLAAVQCDRFRQGDKLVIRSVIWRIFYFVSMIGLAGTSALLMDGAKSTAIARRLSQWLASCSADVWLGRPEYFESLREVLFAFAVPFIILSMISLLLIARIRPHHLCNIAVWMTLLEMGISSSGWICFIDRSGQQTGAKTVARIEEHGSRIVSWSNTLQANIGRDFEALGNVTGSANRLVDVTEYQLQFQVGQTHLLPVKAAMPPIQNLSASYSITPREFARVRRLLQTYDSMSEKNDVLDTFLGWLGVTHRLARRTTISRPEVSVESANISHRQLGRLFYWHRISNVANFIEFRTLNGPLPQEGFDGIPSTARLISSRIRPSKIELHVECVESARIVIRQFQDGLWRASYLPVGDRGLAQPVQLAPYAHLFQSLVVPPGKSIIIVEYRPWPVWLGGAISIVAWALVLLGLLFRGKFRKRA